jgi:hypothetical protein
MKRPSLKLTTFEIDCLHLSGSSVLTKTKRRSLGPSVFELGCQALLLKEALSKMKKPSPASSSFVGCLAVLMKLPEVEHPARSSQRACRCLARLYRGM